MQRRLFAGLTCVAGCSVFVDTGDLSDPNALVSSDAASDVGDATDASVDPGPSVTADAGADGSPATPERIVADWPFDEGSGTMVSDVSGHDHHGLVFGNGVWTADHAGVDGRAYELKTSSDYVAIAASSDFDRASSSTTFSMTIWARTAEAPDHDMFFSVSYGDTDDAFGLELKSPTSLTYFDGKDHAAEATVPNILGAWHHYAVVVDVSQVSVYFDGVRVGQGSADRTPRKAKEVLFGRSTWGDRFTGAIDKARFFRVALTDAEVLAEKNR